MKGLKRVYAEFAKVEELDDGTIKVWGFASSEAIDSDGEIIKSDAIKAALPDYMKFGAVREMHQPIAAGTAIDAEVQDDGKTWFGAHVVDPVAVKKVNAGVYKGFSIGGKVTDRDKVNKNTITGIKLVEVSLVDRPANPEAVFEIIKVESEEDEAVDPEKEAIESIAKMLNEKAITATALLKAGQDSLVAIEPRAKIVPADVKKGMYSLHDFVSAIAQIGLLAQDAASEAQWEGDSSPLPAQLKDWLAQGIMIFENMVTEETSELLASLKAAMPADVAKAGAKYSKETKAALADVHKSMKECCSKMDSLGYDKDDDKQGDDDKDKAAHVDVEKSEATTEVEKTDTAADLLKAELAKRDEQINDLLKTVDSLKSDVERLNAQPLPGKALLKAISKGEDVSTDDKDIKVDPILKADGTTDEAATLIKSIHSRGGKPFNPFTSSI